MKRTLALILALIMMMALVACGGDKPTSSTPSNPTTSEPKQADKVEDINKDVGKVEIKEDVKYKKNLVIGLSGKTTTMDPYVVMNQHHDTLFKMTHNSLCYYDFEKGEIVPELATEWSVSDDGLTWTFKLQEGVKFHNGETLEADDVVATFERAKATGVAGATTYAQIEEVKAVDKQTVTMKLVAPNADWLFMMQYPNCSILNREALEKDTMAGHEIGTGGWKVESWENGADCVMTRFDDSWVWKETGLTPTEKITFATMTETSARLVATQTGEVDFNNGITLGDVPMVEKDPNLKSATMAVETIFFLGFNNETGACSELNLRKAIAYAVNPQEILDAFYEGYGELCETFWGPGQFGKYTDYADPLETNIEKAKEWLAKSNYKGETLKFVTLAQWSDMGALVQGQLGLAGIKIDIHTVDSQGLNATCKAKDYDFFLYNKSCGPQGDQFRTVLTYGHNTNRGHFNSPRVMELLDLAKSENDQAKRLAMYLEIQQITHDEMPYRPLFYGTAAYAWNKNVSGVQFGVDTKQDFTYIVCVDE